MVVSRSGVRGCSASGGLCARITYYIGRESHPSGIELRLSWWGIRGLSGYKIRNVTENGDHTETQMVELVRSLPFNCYSCTVWAIEYSKSWGLPAGIYWWSHRRCISAGGFRRHSSRDPDAPRVVRQQGRAEKRNAFRLLSIAAVHDLPKIGANRRTCAAQPELLYARPRRFAWTTRLM